MVQPASSVQNFLVLMRSIERGFIALYKVKNKLFTRLHHISILISNHHAHLKTFLASFSKQCVQCKLIHLNLTLKSLYISDRLCRVVKSLPTNNNVVLGDSSILRPRLYLFRVTFSLTWGDRC